MMKVSLKSKDLCILEMEKQKSEHLYIEKHTVMEALEVDEAEVVETCPVCVKSNLNPCVWG